MSDSNDIERVRSALAHVPPHDRDIWLRMGMAVKSELGEEGFSVWDEWSQADETYNDGDARAVWRSISPNGKVSAGTLFHAARANGWKGDSQPVQPPPAELQQRQRAAAARLARDAAECAAERAGTAVKAAAIWKAARPATEDHPYLARKQVSPGPTLREIDAEAARSILAYMPKSGDLSLSGRLVVVPVKQGDKLSTVELIDETGRKAALAGRGSKSGGYWAAQAMPDSPGTLLIAEGVATALTCLQATGFPVIAALSAVNLEPVARQMREHFPAADLVVVADLEKGKPEAHPRAVTAARAVGCRLAVPDFGDSRPETATDFNDLAQNRGLQEVELQIGAAKVSDCQPTAGVRLVPASEIEPEAVKWLWPFYLAQGAFHIIAGAPGTGKTTCALSLMATVSRGGKWPDGTSAPRGHAVIWSGEDRAEDTLIPRLMAAGADLSAVHLVADVYDADGRRPFDPATDLELLKTQMAALPNVKLLIVDSVVSAVAGDGNKNNDVRRGLQPLVALAQSMQIAVVGISHYSKGTRGRDPIERVTGSIAYSAQARMVLGTGKSGEADGPNVITRAKSNLGPDGGGFEYRVSVVEVRDGIPGSRVEWGAALDGTAVEILGACEADPDERAEGQDAAAWLEDLLSAGPMAAADVKATAQKAGHAWRTVQRIREKVGVETKRDGFGPGSRCVWSLHRRQTPPIDAIDARFNSLAPMAPMAPMDDVQEEF